MDGQAAIDAEIATLRAMVEGPDDDLASFVAERPYLDTADEARDEIARLIVSLEDVRAGRVVSHAQMLAEAELRRQRYDPQAAE